MAKIPSPMDDYQAQSDMHTLMEAHAIKSNPKRHAAAKAHAKKKLAGMSAIVAGEKNEPPAQEKKETPKQRAAEKKAGLD